MASCGCSSWRPRFRWKYLRPSSARLFRHQLLLLGPAQPLDGQFPLQGRRLGLLWLAVGQFHGKPAAGVSGRLAGSVGFEPLGQVVGDARVDLAVRPDKEVDVPAGGRGAAGRHGPDHGCRGAPPNRAWRAARTSGGSEARRAARSARASVSTATGDLGRFSTPTSDLTSLCVLFPVFLRLCCVCSIPAGGIWELPPSNEIAPGG